MEGEINNFFMVWSIVVVSLFYCHTIIGNITKKGPIRFITILPVMFLFLWLPLNLTSIYLGGTSSFFVTWLANFKLLLFAFGKGPLSTNPPLPLRRFIPLACFPIKIHHNPSPQSHQNLQNSSKIEYPSPQIHQIAPIHRSPLNYAIKALVFSTIIPVYERKELINTKIFHSIYCLYIYTGLELILALVAFLCRNLLGVELEPQFNDPYLATSLQDFWGRRWNLMVSSILRPTVYNPIRSIFSRWFGRKWAALPAVFSSFLVSGLMHELIFFYIGRKEPTWEVTLFFLIHGVSLALEIGIKKTLNGKWKFPVVLSGILAVGFVLVTGLWLFLPAFMKCDADIKGHRETLAFMEFVKEQSRVLRFRAGNVGAFSSFH